MAVTQQDIERFEREAARIYDIPDPGRAVNCPRRCCHDSQGRPLQVLMYCRASGCYRGVCTHCHPDHGGELQCICSVHYVEYAKQKQKEDERRARERTNRTRHPGFDYCGLEDCNCDLPKACLFDCKNCGRVKVCDKDASHCSRINVCEHLDHNCGRKKIYTPDSRT